MLQNSDLTLEQIAEKVGYNSKSSVTLINNGSYHFDSNLSYPLRKTKLEKNIEAARLLRDTNLTVKQIAKQAGLSETTVRNINKGKYRQFEGYTYPIR